MPKEKNFNPVQAAKKAEKQKQLKKQKANLQAQRNEKLARRNPARIQRDIETLKALSESGEIRPHERQRLAELEKDFAAVNKARATLGDKAPQFRERRDDDGERGSRGGTHDGRGLVRGKRTRDGGWKGRDNEDSSDTDLDVKDIPMPRDTPPPIPRRRQSRGLHAQDEAPVQPKKPTLVYEAAPQVRDLRKEAARFVPAAVAQRLKQAKEEPSPAHEEESSKLKEQETAGRERGNPEDAELEEFLKSTGSETTGKIIQNVVEAAAEEARHNMMAAEANGQIRNLETESKVAERNLRHVEIEEVEDEDL